MTCQNCAKLKAEVERLKRKDDGIFVKPVKIRTGLDETGAVICIFLLGMIAGNIMGWFI